MPQITVFNLSSLRIGCALSFQADSPSKKRETKIRFSLHVGGGREVLTGNRN